ncbi:MAG: lysoplasmalogenase [Bacilli bacterium]|nr:lysoplasmalogenase [Bacilli bacterium]
MQLPKIHIDFGHISNVQWVFVWIFLGLFLVTSIINLVFAYLEKEKERKITKCPCTLSLAFAVIAFAPSEWLIYCGLFAGLVGDFFLIWKKKKRYLALGSLAFFIGHVFYIIRLAQFSLPGMGDYSWAYFSAWVVAAIIFLCAFYALGKKIIGHGKLATALMFYLAILGSLIIWSIIGCCIDYHFAFLFITALGAITFLVSDSLIGYTMFTKDIKRRDFFIMATYLVAQLLVVSGMLLTAITTVTVA